MPSKAATFRMESDRSTPVHALTLAQRRLTETPSSGPLTPTPTNRRGRGELRIRTSPGCVRALVERYESQATPPESPSQRVVSGGYFHGKHDDSAVSGGCALDSAFDSKNGRMRVLTPESFHDADRREYSAANGVRNGLHNGFEDAGSAETKGDLSNSPCIYGSESEYEDGDDTHPTDAETCPARHDSLLVPGLRITKGGVTVQHPARLNGLPSTPQEKDHSGQESFGQVIADITDYISKVQQGITPPPLASASWPPSLAADNSASMYPAPLFDGRDSATVTSFWKDVRRDLHIADSELGSPVPRETRHQRDGPYPGEDYRVKDSASMSQASNSSGASSTLERKLSDLESFVENWGAVARTEAREKKEKRSVGIAF